MNKQKKLAFFAVLFIAVASLIVYAYSAEPQKVASDDCADCDTAETTVFEGEISPLDPSTAKFLKVQLEELSSETCANEIATSLASLGSIGKIKCDLTTKQFDVQYHSGELTEEKVLEAFSKSGHPGKIISRL